MENMENFRDENQPTTDQIKDEPPIEAYSSSAASFLAFSFLVFFFSTSGFSATAEAAKKNVAQGIH